MAKSMSFEKKLEELNNILCDLEYNENSLEDSLKLYEKGVKLADECYKILDKAEQKLTVLNPKNIAEEGESCDT